MRDTDPVTRALQDEAHHRLSGSELLRVACEMSDLARGLAVARLRQAHPDWPPRRVARELLRAAFSPKPLPPELS